MMAQYSPVVRMRKTAFFNKPLDMTQTEGDECF